MAISMIIRAGPLGNDTFAQKEAAFRAALRLPGLRRMPCRVRVKRRSKRRRFGDPSEAEMGWGKNTGNLNHCENPAADLLQEQRTLIFGTPYDCRFGQGRSVPVYRPCDCVVGFHRRPQDGRRLTAVRVRARLPERARISRPSTISTAKAQHNRTVTMAGSHRNGWM